MLANDGPAGVAACFLVHPVDAKKVSERVPEGCEAGGEGLHRGRWVSLFGGGAKGAVPAARSRFGDLLFDPTTKAPHAIGDLPGAQPFAIKTDSLGGLLISPGSALQRLGLDRGRISAEHVVAVRLGALDHFGGALRAGLLRQAQAFETQFFGGHRQCPYHQNFEMKCTATTPTIA